MNHGNTTCQNGATTRKHRSLWLELFKVFLFYCVAWVHVGNNPTFLNLARMALPMFFMVSGCYCYTERREGEEDETYQQRKVASTKKKIISMFKYLAFGYAFWFLFDIVFKGFIQGENLAGVFKGFFVNDLFSQVFIYNHVNNSGGHMWFLLALFSISFVHYFITKARIDKLYFFLPSLIIVFFFFAVYLNKYEGDVVWGDMTRNALFFGLPCFATGFDIHYLVSKYVDTKAKKIVLASVSFAFAVSLFFLQLPEWKALGFNGECYISGFLSAAFFTSFFLLCPSPDPRYFSLITGTGLSFYAYIYHTAVAKVLDSYVTFVGNSRPYIIISVSLAIAIVTHWLITLGKYVFHKVMKGRAFHWSLS